MTLFLSLSDQRNAHTSSRIRTDFLFTSSRSPRCRRTMGVSPLMVTTVSQSGCERKEGAMPGGHENGRRIERSNYRTCWSQSAIKCTLMGRLGRRVGMQSSAIWPRRRVCLMKLSAGREKDQSSTLCHLAEGSYLHSVCARVCACVYLHQMYKHMVPL